MKKIILISLFSLVALTSFAQETITVTGTIYTDYKIDRAALDADIPGFDAFNVSKANVKGVWNINDNLVSTVDYAVLTSALSKAYVDWTAAESFVITAGRFTGIFAPESFEGSGTYDGVSAAYTIGDVKVAANVANTKDGNGPLHVMGALSYSPVLGGLELGTGVSARYSTHHDASKTTITYPAGVKTETVTYARVDAKTDLSAYLTASISDLSLTASTELNSVEKDMTLGFNTAATYTLGTFTLNAASTHKNIIHVSSDPLLDVSGYIKKSLTDAVAVKLSTKFENVMEVSGTDKDYHVTLSFQFTPSYSF